jgi:hypothetical protein
MQAVLFVALSISFFPSKGLTLSIGLAFMGVAFTVLYPQLMFKPQLRTLVLDRDGLKTTIGTKSGARAWQELKSIEDVNEYLIITGKNGNTFIIPPRAFATPERRADFHSFAQSSWIAARA